jgi:hypothetical protein
VAVAGGGGEGQGQGCISWRAALALDSGRRRLLCCAQVPAACRLGSCSACAPARPLDQPAHLSYMEEKRSSAAWSASLRPAEGGCMICASASMASW